MIKARWSLLLLLLLLWSGAAWSQTEPGPAPASEAAIPEHSGGVRGAANGDRHHATYDRYCLSCHGVDGDGHGPSAVHFGSIATNFTTGVYKCRSTPATSLPTDADLERSIRHGLSGSAMPPFGTLGPLELDDVRASLKSFSERWARESPQAALELPAEPAPSDAAVARGVGVYRSLKCATCHGDRGRGAPGGMNLRDDQGNPSRVADLTDRHATKCGAGASDLYRTLMTGLSGTPMSGYAEVLSPQDGWDLVRYLESLRR